MKTSSIVNAMSVKVFINRHSKSSLKNNVIYSIYKTKENKKSKLGCIVRVRINKHKDIVLVGANNNNIGVITSDEFEILKDNANKFYDKCVEVLGGVNEEEKLYSAEDVAKMLGISVDEVEEIATKYSLKNSKYGKWK